MTDAQKKMLGLVGATVADTKPKAKTATVNISREDYDLLDVPDEDTMYYITEDDGSITVRKG